MVGKAWKAWKSSAPFDVGEWIDFWAPYIILLGLEKNMNCQAYVGDGYGFNCLAPKLAWVCQFLGQNPESAMVVHSVPPIYVIEN